MATDPPGPAPKPTLPQGQGRGSSISQTSLPLPAPEAFFSHPGWTFSQESQASGLEHLLLASGLWQMSASEA
jgi:hypothetical protein